MHSSIFDEDVYGMAYRGKEIDLRPGARRVTRDTPLLLVGEAKDFPKAEGFFAQHGMTRCSRFVLSGGADVLSLRTALREQGDGIVFLLKDRYEKPFQTAFNGQSYQLFSRYRAYFKFMQPALRQVYDLLEDEVSRETFTRVLNVRFKLADDAEVFSVFQPDQYFTPPEMNRFTPDSVFVDCGAFVGDTIEKYIWHSQGIFRRIYGFEPGMKQRTALEHRKARLVEEWALDDDQISIVPAGVGEATQDMALVKGVMSDLAIGTKLVPEAEADEASIIDRVHVVSLDEYFRDREPGIDMIKADVEGSELALLQGAQEIIRRDRPNLAISLYHKLTDYFELPLYIKSLVPEYHLRICHHATNFTETVVYAYVD